MGDARLSLGTAPDASYGMIILDAFSSDAIPIHLVTREALSLYLAKLKPDGILVFHISNRFLELAPVMGSLARDAGLVCLLNRQLGVSIKDQKNKFMGCEWVVMARTQEDLGDLVQDRGWVALKGQKEPHPWTDDYSDIIRYLKDFPGL